MKKIFLGLSAMFAFIIIGIISTSYAKDGDLFDTGPNHDFRIGSDGTIYTTEGLPKLIEWMDLPTSSTRAFVGTDGINISTKTLTAGGTTFVVGTTGVSNQFTQITFPRNVVCVVNFRLDHATATVTGSLLVSGKDHKGNSTTETILISTGTAVRPGIGVKAWSWIDSFEFSGFSVVNSTSAAVADANAHLFIGTGEKIGLGYDIVEATDVYKTTVDSVDYSTCTWKYAGDPTYDVIDTNKLGPSLNPNAARDFRFWLKVGLNR